MINEKNALFLLFLFCSTRKVLKNSEFTLWVLKKKKKKKTSPINKKSSSDLYLLK